MKKNLPYFVVALFALVLLSACTRAQSTPFVSALESPTPEVLTQLPAAIATQTAAPTPIEATLTTLPPAPTDVPVEAPTVAATAIPAEATPTTLPPAPTDAVVETPTPTVIPPSATPPGEAFDPRKTYGEPAFSDPMNSSSYGNWISGNSLPNTSLLQISLQGDALYVTGKQPGFSTWYFSWPTLTNFYLQLTVESGQCSGKDEYGLIVRGPAHGAGVSYGYIAAFTCNGSYRLARLDSADPFTVTGLIPLTQSDLIRRGANQKNVLAIKADGSKLTLFANGYSLAEVTDATFSQGRYGFFVQGVETANYTYRPLELLYWNLSK